MDIDVNPYEPGQVWLWDDRACLLLRYVGKERFETDFVAEKWTILVLEGENAGETTHGFLHDRILSGDRVGWERIL